MNAQRLLPLELKFNPDGYMLFRKRNNAPGFDAFRQKVLMRDQNTCQYCNFQAKNFLEVTNIDGNYNNNKMSNLVTTCPYCVQCQFVDQSYQGNGACGTLILLSKISQNYLNSFCHVLFCAIENETSYKPLAQSIYRELRNFSKPIESMNEGLSDPIVFGKTMFEVGINNDVFKSERFKHVRLLPSRIHFMKQIEIWSKEAIENFNSENQKAPQQVNSAQ